MYGISDSQTTIFYINAVYTGIMLVHSSGTQYLPFNIIFKYQHTIEFMQQMLRNRIRDDKYISQRKHCQFHTHLLRAYLLFKFISFRLSILIVIIWMNEWMARFDDGDFIIIFECASATKTTINSLLFINWMNEMNG